MRLEQQKQMCSNSGHEGHHKIFEQIIIFVLLMWLNNRKHNFPYDNVWISQYNPDVHREGNTCITLNASPNSQTLLTLSFHSKSMECHESSSKNVSRDENEWMNERANERKSRSTGVCRNAHNFSLTVLSGTAAITNPPTNRPTTTTNSTHHTVTDAHACVHQPK